MKPAFSPFQSYQHKNEGIRSQSPFLNYDQIDATVKESYEKFSSSLHQRIDVVAQKISILSNQIYEINKSACHECQNYEISNKNLQYQQLCSICNSIICSECLTKCKCLVCNKRLCTEHSRKCYICEKRVCLDVSCLSQIKECKKCGTYLCIEHIEDHNKLENAGPFGLKCGAKECKILENINSKLIPEVSSLLLHEENLKELVISNPLIRQLRNLRV